MKRTSMLKFIVAFIILASSLVFLFPESDLLPVTKAQACNPPDPTPEPTPTPTPEPDPTPEPTGPAYSFGPGIQPISSMYYAPHGWGYEMSSIGGVVNIPYVKHGDPNYGIYCSLLSNVPDSEGVYHWQVDDYDKVIYDDGENHTEWDVCDDFAKGTPNPRYAYHGGWVTHGLDLKQPGTYSGAQLEDDGFFYYEVSDTEKYYIDDQTADGPASASGTVNLVDLTLQPSEGIFLDNKWGIEPDKQFTVYARPNPMPAGGITKVTWNVQNGFSFYDPSQPDLRSQARTKETTDLMVELISDPILPPEECLQSGSISCSIEYNNIPYSNDPNLNTIKVSSDATSEALICQTEILTPQPDWNPTPTFRYLNQFVVHNGFSIDGWINATGYVTPYPLLNYRWEYLGAGTIISDYVDSDNK